MKKETAQAKHELTLKSINCHMLLKYIVCDFMSKNISHHLNTSLSITEDRKILLEMIDTNKER